MGAEELIIEGLKYGKQQITAYYTSQGIPNTKIYTEEN